MVDVRSVKSLRRFVRAICGADCDERSIPERRYALGGLHRHVGRRACNSISTRHPSAIHETSPVLAAFDRVKKLNERMCADKVSRQCQPSVESIAKKCFPLRRCARTIPSSVSLMISHDDDDYYYIGRVRISVKIKMEFSDSGRAL